MVKTETQLQSALKREKLQGSKSRDEMSRCISQTTECRNALERYVQRVVEEIGGCIRGRIADGHTGDDDDGIPQEHLNHHVASSKVEPLISSQTDLDINERTIAVEDSEDTSQAPAGATILMRQSHIMLVSSQESIRRLRGDIDAWKISAQEDIDQLHATLVSIEKDKRQMVEEYQTLSECVCHHKTPLHRTTRRNSSSNHPFVASVY